ncbi:hypothetical protein [Neisseria meningitidis]|uniref:hypothetical protein n=1 Tax=Neisseria meningitidis TaxID=487 RepID=UPI0002D85852|nr:hypothetical protein [Neisseria meningitidis]
MLIHYKIPRVRHAPRSAMIGAVSFESAHRDECPRAVLIPICRLFRIGCRREMTDGCRNGGRREWEEMTD